MGKRTVSGLRRVPKPPTRIKACTGVRRIGSAGVDVEHSSSLWKWGVDGGGVGSKEGVVAVARMGRCFSGLGRARGRG